MSVLEKITPSELEFCEGFHTPRCLIESLFSNFDNLTEFDENKFGEVRIYQQPLISDEILIDFDATAEYHHMNKQEKFDLRKNVGDIYNYGGRAFGKSMCVIILDMIISMIHLSGTASALASSSIAKIRAILDRVKVVFKGHPIVKLWEDSIRASNSKYVFQLKNNHKLESVNYKIGKKSSASDSDWYGLHVHRVYIEEACVSGRTRISCVDKQGIRKSLRISELVNNNKWKDYNVYTYNFKKKKIEIKPIVKTFKKTVPNYIYNKVETFANDNNKKRVIESSQKQKFYTKNDCKYVSELKVGDSLLNKDYQKLNNTQYDYLDEHKITNITSVQTKQWTMYDIEVKDNHNFFANGILIHNSLENESVAKARADALSELGAIFRISGMTNFSRNSPSGQVFYDKDYQHLVVNLPQYVNPRFTAKKNKDRLKKFGDAGSIFYRMFVKGEVVSDAETVFDYDKICINEKKRIKFFEINDKTFNDFKKKIIVERPKNAENVFICADVSDLGITEIIIIFEINNKYYYHYNIVLHGIDGDKSKEFFRWLGLEVKANYYGIDATDSHGRNVCRYLQQEFGKERVLAVGFNEKLPIDYVKDEKGIVIKDKDDKPIPIKEWIPEWSITRLLKLFYNENLIINLDYKFETQITQVVVSKSGARMTPKCLAEEDHLFQAFQVFSILQWHVEFGLLSPVEETKANPGMFTTL